MNRKKMKYGVIVSVLAIATMVTTTSTANAISLGSGNKAGLGDLFVLDNLFKGSTNNRILGTGTNGKTDLGNLFILNKLFNETETPATPTVVPTVTPAVPLTLAQQLAGRILIQVESKGEAWYVNPVTGKRSFLGTPAEALKKFASVSLGISNSDFANIQSTGVPSRLVGRILIKTEDSGKLYYVNPVNRAIVSLGSPNEVVNVIKQVGLGISNANIVKIAVAN